MSSATELAAVGLAGAAALWACSPWRSRPASRRLDHERGVARSPVCETCHPRVAIRVARSVWNRWTWWLGVRLLGVVARPRGVRDRANPSSKGPRRSSPVAVAHASDPTASTDDRATRLGAAATVGVLGAAITPVLGLAAAGLVWARPAWRARSRRRAHERDLVQAMPDLVELFRLAIGSGLSVHQAVHALAARRRGPAADALAEVVARQDRGERLADGLEGLTRRGEPLRPLAAALIAADRYGAPLGPALDRVSSEARELRRRQAEEAARRLPVVMLFPLVLCILPAAALLTVVPLLAASWPRLTG